MASDRKKRQVKRKVGKHKTAKPKSGVNRIGTIDDPKKKSR